MQIFRVLLVDVRRRCSKIWLPKIAILLNILNALQFSKSVYLHYLWKIKMIFLHIKL